MSRPQPASSPSTVIDGWRCVDFTSQTGHVVGRSAQLGDLQIHVTSGEPLEGELPRLTERVLEWLLSGGEA